MTVSERATSSGSGVSAPSPAPEPAHDGLSVALAPIYDVLQGVSEASRDAAAAMLPILERRLADHREIARQIRDLLRVAEEDEARIEDAVARARLIADPASEALADLAVLRGRRLVTVAVEALTVSGRAQPIHYKEWFRLLRSAGHRVGGADPIATFLTSLSRDDRVERVGARTGLYRLKEEL